MLQEFLDKIMELYYDSMVKHYLMLTVPLISFIYITEIMQFIDIKLRIFTFMILCRFINWSFFYSFLRFQTKYFIVSYMKRAFFTQKISIEVHFRFTCDVSFRLKNCGNLVCTIFKKVFVDSNFVFKFKYCVFESYENSILTKKHSNKPKNVIMVNHFESLT